MAATEPEHSPLPANPSPARPRQVDGYSLLQFLLSLLTVLVSGGLALVFIIMGLREGLPAGLITLTIAAASGWLGFLLLPSMVFSFLRLIGSPVQADFLSQRGLRLAGLAVFLFPFALYLGNWALNQDSNASLAFPIFHVIATSLPVAWVIYLAVRGLPVGSPQRAWGVFGSGLIVGPAIALTIESIVMIAALIITAIVIFSQPGLADELTALVQMFESAPQTPPDQQAILEILGPFLSQPIVIVGVLVFASLIVPLIEEAVKPIGVWLLAGRRITPATGFAAGALSGAGFALFENLLLASGTEGWATLQVARLGTSAVHILATGLVGFALASTWQKRHYGRLLGVYFGAVLLHGTWNAFSMLMTFGEIQSSLAATPNKATWLTNLAEWAPYVMGGLALASLGALIWFNVRLRREKDIMITQA